MENIRVMFDPATGQVQVHAPLSNQMEKDLSVKVLAAAITIVVNYQVSPILRPAGHNGNGKLHVVPPTAPAPIVQPPPPPPPDTPQAS